MNEPVIPQELYDFIKAIASESRIRILLLFMDGQERTVNQITQAVELGQSTTSEHLTTMKRSGLLEKKPSEIRMDTMKDSANEPRIIEGIKKLISE